ncbi:hypothetical protein ASPWEDRAFT_112951 [Aspergillus wentii DTO 134E9]|uniref:Zn(2)-C6 fungal-type domain-containing protein n=1 Tax=Aspergillus wentii DTO 134E9 TaxID=1073089 RepID=A0A1L9RI18_ASPWE|nr:uncharacterized protein ASPWEDRAFT_112951 [Aspergillus wentii DTO 134E9]OJJ34569.1 hypothetical protein ASPWEDRAFT_112951 [Aspergillus wentii DTO 134E9]
MLQRTKRAARACYWCRHRKVRCDASIRGCPCTRCQQDGRDNCTLRLRIPRRSKNSDPDSEQQSTNPTRDWDFNNLDESVDKVFNYSRISDGLDAVINLDGDTSFIFYPFLELHGLLHLAQEDVTYLSSKGCFSIPNWLTINEFARQYFLQIHPCLPVLDEAEFWRIAVDSDNGFTGSRKISLFVFQAFLFASCPFVPLETLQKCGFTNKRDARTTLYNRAKLLFDLKAETDPFAKAQGAVLLTHHTSTDDPQAGSIWLMRAIQNAMIVGCSQEISSTEIVVSMKKRLWWSILLRDRVISIGLRRRPQVTSMEFNTGDNWLKEEDFSEDISQSRVYEEDVKILLFQVMQEQCRLAVLLTDMVALVFSSHGISSPSLSLPEFKAVIAAIKRIKCSLDKWEAGSSFLPSTSHEPVTLFTNLTYMYYYAARVDLAQYEAMIIEKHLAFTGNDYPNQLVNTGKDLQNAMTGLTGVMEFFSGEGRAERLPLSVLAYAAMPLVLTAIDVKLSPSQSEMIIRQRRLERLGEIVRHSKALYDVTDFVAMKTNNILQLAYITTQDVFLRCGSHAVQEPPRMHSEISIGSPADTPTDGLGSFIQGRPTNWHDAFLGNPRAYLRISTTVDYGLSNGRLPYENALPRLVRHLPWVGLTRLPWTQDSEEQPNGIDEPDQRKSEFKLASSCDTQNRVYDDIWTVIPGLAGKDHEDMPDNYDSPTERELAGHAVNLDYFDLGGIPSRNSPQSEGEVVGLQDVLDSEERQPVEDTVSSGEMEYTQDVDCEIDSGLFTSLLRAPLDDLP